MVPRGLREPSEEEWMYTPEKFFRILVNPEPDLDCNYPFPIGFGTKRNIHCTSGTQGNELLSLFKSNQIWIAITFFELIWHQTGLSLAPNQSENCNYNSNGQ